MPKFLVHGSYSIEGIKGLVKDGGCSRRSHFGENVGNLGGRLEIFYFALGGDDIYAIIDLPDNVSSAALSLAINAGGGFRAATVALLTPEEVDKAAKKVPSVKYHPPGSIIRP